MPEESRTIGYICPVCGSAVIARRTAFQLAAGDSTLPCPCGKSELGFHQLGDRCEVTVPCLFCAKDHRAVCGNDALLRKKLLALSCPASGLGCCYVGEEDQVFRAVESWSRRWTSCAWTTGWSAGELFWTRWSWRRRWPSSRISPPGAG